MNSVKILKSYEPTSLRESVSGSDSQTLVPDVSSIVSGSLVSSMTQLSVPAPQVGQTYLSGSTAVYTGSNGTVERRSCPFCTTNSYTFAQLGLTEVNIDQLRFLFFNPYIKSNMPAFVVQEDDGSKKKIYWQSATGEKVSTELTADSFQFAICHTGITYNQYTKMYYGNLALFVRSVNNGSFIIRKYDGPGDNMFLPWPYDPDDKTTFEKQYNGQFITTFSPSMLVNSVGIYHDISVVENKILT